MYIPRPNENKTKIAARAIIIHNNKLFVVKHRGSTYWSLPGGKLDDNEDMKSALARELVEELGVEGKVGNLRFINEFRYGEHGAYSLEFFFTIKNPEAFLGESLKGELMEEELSDWGWIEMTEDIQIRPDFLKEEMKGFNPESQEIRYFGC